MGPLVGRGRFLKALLSYKGFEPWAKISFVTYLIHLLIFAIFYNQTRQSTYLSNKVILINMSACMLLSYLIAIPLSAMFEAPFIQLEKTVLFPQRPRSKDASESSISESSVSNQNGKRHKGINSTLSESQTTMDVKTK